MIIEKALKKLILKSPFYGLFLSGINKVVTKRIPTAAVAPRGISVDLLINPEFWETLTDDEQLAILQHEAMHICFNHFLMGESFSDHFLFNIASDAEINQYIPNLPKDCVDIRRLSLEIGETLPAFAGSKFYYEKLQDLKDQNKLPEDLQTGDDHSFWEEFDKLSEPEKKLVQNQIEQQLKQTAEAVKSSPGSIPGELRELLNELLNPKPAVFNWKAYFRRLVGSIISLELKKTRKKPNKRFSDAAGIKFKKKQRVLVCIDTSGSINTEDLEDFFSEVIHMYKAGVGIDILECDCHIGRIYEFTGKPDVKVTGGGGTSCEPIVDYINKNKGKYSAHVYFTDGYLNTQPAEKAGLIWLISSDGDQTSEYPGLTIKIPKTN
jgi:predicted metal-dependent peptidase